MSEGMAAYLSRLTQQAGGDAPALILMAKEDAAELAWRAIPLWVRLQWNRRRGRKVNGYVAVTVRRHRLRFGAGPLA